MFRGASCFGPRFDTRLLQRWRCRRAVLGGDERRLARGGGARRGGQADGLRQRQPERAAVIGRIADIQPALWPHRAARRGYCARGAAPPYPVTLDPAVERARAGRHRAGWQGASRSDGTRRRKDLQRRQRVRGRPDRVRSVLTREVRAVGGAISSAHAVCPADASGQLPDLGSLQIRFWRPRRRSRAAARRRSRARARRVPGT